MAQQTEPSMQPSAMSSAEARSAEFDRRLDLIREPDGALPSHLLADLLAEFPEVKVGPQTEQEKADFKAQTEQLYADIRSGKLWEETPEE